MRVATFNIQHGRAAGGGVDVHSLGLACASLAADILGLQEVDVGVPRSGGQDLARVVAVTTRSTSVFGPATRYRGGEYGNALLVRGDVSDVEVKPLPNAAGLEPRSVLLATATVSGITVSVAVTHLSYEPAEAKAQLPVVAASLGARPAPRLLLGDLNLAPDDVGPVVAAHGLALVTAGGPTFPARRPRQRIDHIATTGLVAGAVAAPRTPVSDHRPLVVEVTG